MKVKFALRNGGVVGAKGNDTSSREELVDFFFDLLGEGVYQGDVATLETKSGVVLVRTTDIVSVEIQD